MRLDIFVASTSRALILVVRSDLSHHTDTIYVDVSASNASRALILVFTASLYSYWHLKPSHTCVHTYESRVHTQELQQRDRRHISYAEKKVYIWPL